MELRVEKQVERRTEDEVVDQIGNEDLQLCLLYRVQAND